jgi:3-aminobutyryl-CoA ammonia-lyase
MNPTIGFSVTHKRYVPYAHAHYGGSLVDGAYGLGMFGDVATELCIRTDGDEGLFAGYSSVEFVAPVQAGDVLEATATIVRVGDRSRMVEFEARVLCRSRGGSSAEVLEPPLVVTRATGTVVVPVAHLENSSAG